MYYRELAESAMDMITVLNQDGSVSYISPSFSVLLGHSPKEITGKKIFDFIHTDDLNILRGEFEKIKENKLKSHSMEFRILHRDGTWRIIEALGKNLLDNSVVKGIVCNCRDITKRKQSEETLATKTAELEKTNRLMVGRELRMMELKQEIENLKKKYGVS